MKARDPNAVQRHLDKLAETQRWAHHVADLDSGKLRTYPLDRPVAPLSRAKRLSRLGHSFDPSIFGGPSYDLTPNVPYRYAPRAYLVAYSADIYSARQSRIYWTGPPNEANPVHREVHFTLTVAPGLPCLVTLNLTGKGWPGMVGHVRFSSWSPSFTKTIAIDAYVAHIVDLTFVPGHEFATIAMFLEPGIELLTFDSLSVKTLPPPLSAG